MSTADQGQTAARLARVIAWEIEAQKGVDRSLDEWPMLIADSLLDFFDVELKSGVDLTQF